jgi:hypothetical protein
MFKILLVMKMMAEFARLSDRDKAFIAAPLSIAGS